MGLPKTGKGLWKGLIYTMLFTYKDKVVIYLQLFDNQFEEVYDMEVLNNFVKTFRI